MKEWKRGRLIVDSSSLNDFVFPPSLWMKVASRSLHAFCHGGEKWADGDGGEKCDKNPRPIEQIEKSSTEMGYDSGDDCERGRESLN